VIYNVLEMARLHKGGYFPHPGEVVCDMMMQFHGVNGCAVVDNGATILNYMMRPVVRVAVSPVGSIKLSKMLYGSTIAEVQEYTAHNIEAFAKELAIVMAEQI
jgi:hypothetical protein